MGNLSRYQGSGLCASSGIKRLEHGVSETGSVSETSCSSFVISDDGQSPEPLQLCHTSSSEAFGS
jgi:hypothetical protein